MPSSLLPAVDQAGGATPQHPVWRRLSWRLAAGALLLLHLGFGLVRLPVGAVWKRAQSIAEYRELGPDGWHFRLADEETRRIARWLCTSVGADELVLVDGERNGPLQLLAPLLFPRLMENAAVWQGNGLHSSTRRVFLGRPPWLENEPVGVPVVCCAAGKLRVEYR